uniref:Uncharacterized protein n=1 Tax=Panagrellus redivivus TaxID=6233 RepID=A0A7E4WAN7_PANRE
MEVTRKIAESTFYRKEPCLASASGLGFRRLDDDAISHRRGGRRRRSLRSDNRLVFISNAVSFGSNLPIPIPVGFPPSEMAASSSSLRTCVSTSSTNVATVATATPSETSTNDTTATTGTTDSDISTLLPRQPIAAHVRFTTALLVLITQGQALVIAQMLLTGGGAAAALGQLVTAFMAFFSVEWIRIHSFALTRQKRAFFDEVNILETYQPRARTHGHLFQPDPPTPGPVVKIADDPNMPARTPSEQAAFNANRDAHYANMFEYALRVAKEAEEADKQALEAQKARIAKEGDGTTTSGSSASATSPSAGSTATAVPTGEPLLDESAVGTKIELPNSMVAPADDKSIRLGEVLSPKGMDSSDMPNVVAASPGSTGSRKKSDKTATSPAKSTGSGASTGSATGKKRRKKRPPQ